MPALPLPADPERELPDPVDRLTRRLKTKYAGRICAELTLPARPAQTEPLPAGLDERLLRRCRRAASTSCTRTRPSPGGWPARAATSWW